MAGGTPGVAGPATRTPVFSGASQGSPAGSRHAQPAARRHATGGPPAASPARRAAPTSSPSWRPRCWSSASCGSATAAPTEFSTLGRGAHGDRPATALYGTSFALVQLVLMARSPWLDQTFGMDGLAVAHRWLGFATVWLLLAHGIATTVGYAARRRDERRRRIPGPGDDLSVRADGDRQRRPLRGRGGQLGPRRHAAGSRTRPGTASTSTPTSRSRSASCTSCSSAPTSCTTRSPRSTGSLLYVADGRARSSRSGSASRSRLSLRHRLRVANVVTEAPGVVSIYVTGRDLERLARPRGPVLPVAVPDARRLVAGASVLDLGRAQRPLAAHHRQGPRRRVARARRASRSGRASSSRARTASSPAPGGPGGASLLIAGGIGITPLRALIEALPAGPATSPCSTAPPARTTSSSATSSRARPRRGLELHYLVGQRGSAAVPQRPARSRGIADPGPGRPRPRRVPVRAGPDDAAVEAALAGLASRGADPRRALQLLSGGGADAPRFSGLLKNWPAHSRLTGRPTLGTRCPGTDGAYE